MVAIPRGPSRKYVEEITRLEIELEQIQKGDFAHFMLKEIFDQEESVSNTMAGRVNFEEKSVRLSMKDYIPQIRRCRRLMFIACGTSYNSALATRAFLEDMTEMPVTIDIAGDFMDRGVPVFRDDCCFFVSQSGETADTLECLRYCRSKGALIVAATNTVGSSMSRESDCGIHLYAGPEIGVASTKAYTSQIIAILMFGLMMAEDSRSKKSRCDDVISSLEALPKAIHESLKKEDEIKKIAAELTDKKSLILLGRGSQFANSVEGALKIKELTYIHAEGIQAGELKHGPLALIDKDCPVIMLMTSDERTLAGTNAALQQVVARMEGAKPIIICDDGVTLEHDGLTVLRVPKLDPYVQPVVSVIALQLLSYHMAVMKGVNVDQPRNLAKSVTVT